eukprot:Cvel_27005.t1-p1 / transcript=Cvel_27005.t1 / gene=Cvel_27005 / organism=Chromera_velia_CCMP2878 / gene_product=hypothetical protein / transcript_product=hypothetical protein / location=Cvel_scaffold3300:12408-13712(-) / protein_length=435 / sequence_SO=supercontig / SO=protein_coding / is_pseudo=false
MATGVLRRLQHLDLSGNFLDENSAIALVGGVRASVVPSLSKVTFWDELPSLPWGEGAEVLLSGLLKGVDELPKNLEISNMYIRHPLSADLAHSLCNSHSNALPPFPRLEVFGGAVRTLVGRAGGVNASLRVPELVLDDFFLSGPTARALTNSFTWGKITQSLVCLRAEMPVAFSPQDDSWLSAEDRLALFESFKEFNFPKLTELSFTLGPVHSRETNLIDLDVIALAGAFRKGTLAAVQTLELSGAFGRVGVEALMGEPGQTHLSGLVTLKFAQSYAGTGMGAISAALSDGRLSRLRDLNLGAGGVDDEGMIIFCEAVRSSDLESLQTLDLSGNFPITFRGLSALRDALVERPSSLTSLKLLKLSNCLWVEGHAGFVLFQILSTGTRLPSLQTLDLRIVGRQAWFAFIQNFTAQTAEARFQRVRTRLNLGLNVIG